MNKVKIAAIIAEFNPLHEGHKHIIKQARTQTEASHVLIIQSGNFTQRAEPAILPKHVRAEEALRNGADAVCEIPTAFATGNAEIFAKASVQIAHSFPHITNLVFGIEPIMGTAEATVALLKKIATAQVKRRKDFERFIKPHIKQGMSFDIARCEVVKKLLPNIPSHIIESAMRTSNNILGIEYLKELCRLKSKIVPIGIARINNLSASEIRKQMIKRRSNIPCYEKFGAMALFNMRRNMSPDIYNSNPELVNLLFNASPATYDDLKLHVPTRRFSISRISRLALHATLGITKKDMAFLYDNEHLPYTNLLAIKSSEGSLFSALCLNENTPLVVRGNRNKPKDSAYARALMRVDEVAELMYQTVCGRIFLNRPVFQSPTLIEAPKSMRKKSAPSDGAPK